MAEFRMSSLSSLKITFGGGGDIAVRATSEDERGEVVATGTFLYGSGKACLMEKGGIALMHIFAALAKGETISPQFKNLEGERMATISPPRPGDKISIGSNEEGDLTFVIEGQDLGFPSIVSLEIQNQAGGETATRSLYNGLHNYLAEYGAPKVS